MSATIERSLGEPMPVESTRSDTDLWLRCHEDAPDAEQAFAELFERHVAALWNFGYRLTGSWATAEDVAANTFLIAWRKRHTMRLEQDNALPWLFTVASNLARTEYRRQGRFRRALSRLPDTSSQPDHADHVAADVDARRHAEAIAAAVAKLPRGEREAVELCLLGELSTAQAAAALGIAEVSVRSRISRARARLRTMLEELDR